MKTIDRKKDECCCSQKKSDIVPNTMVRWKKIREVTIQVIQRTCEAFDSDFGEIMEYISDEDNKRGNWENRNGYLIETSVRSTINHKGGADNGR